MTGATWLDLLLLVGAVWLPGAELVWLALDIRDPLVLGTVGAVAGLFLIPLVAFAVAVGAGTYIQLPLVIGIAVPIHLLAGAKILWRRRRGRMGAPTGS